MNKGVPGALKLPPAPLFQEANQTPVNEMFIGVFFLCMGCL
jgi:hypothetical protein